MLSVFSRAVLVAGIFALSASATFYDGKINITGDGVLATNTFIDFQNPVGGGYGDIELGVTHTGSFASWPTNSVGTVKDLGPVPTSNFFTFPGLLPASADWYLAGLVPQTATTPCPAVMIDGQSCTTFLGSPILLTKTATGTSATLNLFGTITDGGDVSYWRGIFSAQFTDLTPAQVSAQAAGAGTDPVSWSGNLTVESPEPGTIFLGLAGLAGIMIGRARRNA